MKQRLDIELVNRGLLSTRAKASAYIKEGVVEVNGKVIAKPSTLVSSDDKIEITKIVLPYVSRGGLKLEKAIKVFGLNLTDLVVLDLGASTGGFTDCALQNGAKKVYAVDIGTGQLDSLLKDNEKVVNLENTDVRTLDKKYVYDSDIIVGDISFISLLKVLPNVINNMTKQKLMILIKPQFEAGLSIIKKCKGVIKDVKVSKHICEETICGLKSLGLKLIGLEESPIKGGDGNTEYLALFEKTGF